ncbi:ComEC/Rec2 family competence protein [Microbacterium ulmi]|uniref:MBL fold metallo-hydrolase n=1 Tax=Microbacterium ulmi TaxID=179095 RepID=A0A7Y2LZK6_9MICO|nr:ComEC/Rec2 family competence protein [Microbacterium ulmi]NII71096.1 competence protein ComEC [Microbacterium ulmi]NNH02403.1 MBL fold metallo-hydrolase [Microbacterium ulmi]
MNVRGLRLVPVAAAAWGAAAAATLVPAHAWVLALVAWGLGVLSLRAFARRMPRVVLVLPRVVLVLLLVASAAVASHVALAQPARIAASALGLDGGRALTVTAVVTGKAETWVTGTIAFDAVTTSLASGADTTALRIDVVITVEPDAVDGRVDVGARVVARGSARPADAGARAVLVVQATRGVEVVEEPPGVLETMSGLRRGLVAAVEGLPTPGAGLVPGLAVGDTSSVDAELDAAMKSSSLSHLTAVSGANCALVVGIAFGAASAFGAGRRLRVLVSLAALVGFVLLVTPEPSVVRAAAMATVAMLAVLLGRAATGMSVLSLAVTVLLVVDPWLSTSLGFALSAVATASLLLLARPLAAGLARRMPRALALAFSVPLAAQLACGPLLVLITPSVPVYGVVANLLAGPAAPLATIAGLAACLAAPLPWLQSGLAAIAWAPAAWIAATAHTFATLPGAQLPWIDGVLGLMALAAVGAAVAVLLGVRGAGRRHRILRAASCVLLALAVGIAAGSVALTSSVAGRFTLPGDWSVLACDVGQGDAVLVRSGSSVALVDTGPDPDRLAACLSRTGVGQLDLLVLTHFDLDHVGGVDAVRGRVGTVVHGPATASADRALVADLVSAGAEAVQGAAGLHGTLGDAQWRVVWPPRASHAFPSGNDASVVVEIEGGGVPASLWLGDLSASPQRALAASGVLDPPYALVKVAHHGSADQDAGLYRLLDPAIALICVGVDNDYGHPRAETIGMLESLGATIARTDTQGVIAVSSAPTGLIVSRDRAGL